ncbi:MAG: hypothetical protein ACPG4Y_05180 [Chitinophagales bacterium]
MGILEQKKEIIDWILSLENKEILNDIYKFKTQTATFNFEEEFEKGITSDELKEKTTEFLKSLPWKR